MARRRYRSEGMWLAAAITAVAWVVAHPAWWVLALIFAFWTLVGLVL